MLYIVSWEIAHPEQSPVSGNMPVEALSEERAVEFAQHVLEEQYPGEQDFLLLECEVRKPGRPVEREGIYRRITLEIRSDLLAKIDASGKSRREYIEELLSK